MEEPIAVWDPQTKNWLHRPKPKRRRKKEEELTPPSSVQWEPYSVTFPKSGMTRTGQLFPLPASEHLTSGTASSSSRTRRPLGDDNWMLSTPDTAPEAPNSKSNMTTQPAGLGNQVKDLLRTPQAQVTEAKPGIKLEGRKPSDPQVGLADQIATLPTPTTLDHVEKRTMHGGGNLTLQGAVGGVNPKDVERHVAAGRRPEMSGEVEVLPTPTASSPEGRNSTCGRADPDTKHHSGNTLVDALIKTGNIPLNTDLPVDWDGVIE